MNITAEENDAVVIEISATEAGRIAADILTKAEIAGADAEVLAQRLRAAGYFLEISIPYRSEWAGPDE